MPSLSLGEQTVMIISLFAWCLDIHTHIYIVVYTNNFLDFFCIWSEATPKALMRMMGIPGLTLYHLKSHLQALLCFFFWQWYLEYFDGELHLKYFGVICSCRNIGWGKATNQRPIMKSTNQVSGIELGYKTEIIDAFVLISRFLFFFFLQITKGIREEMLNFWVGKLVIKSRALLMSNISLSPSRISYG